MANSIMISPSFDNIFPYAYITLAIGDLRSRFFAPAIIFWIRKEMLAIAIHNSRLDICQFFIIETQMQSKCLCSHVSSLCIETKIDDNISWKNMKSIIQWWCKYKNVNSFFYNFVFFSYALQEMSDKMYSLIVTSVIEKHLIASANANADAMSNRWCDTGIREMTIVSKM